MIDTIVIRGYRSVRQVRVALDRVTVVVGENGTGKSNLYRGLQLFQHAAAGTLAPAITTEGGMSSVLWAGDRKRHEQARVHVEATMDDFGFELDLGLPTPMKGCAFNHDPEVKVERVSVGDVPIAERAGATATLRDADGDPVLYPSDLWPGESVLSQIADPARFPALPALRDRFLGWRFYHYFPVHDRAPTRQPMVPVRTPTLASDGHDLPSALRTIQEIGDEHVLDAAVDEAFPGCRLVLDGRTVAMETPGLRRPLTATELSDGTLRYLCLLAALLTPRPPSLLAFNEPESSLHPDLLAPLAHLVAAVPDHCQLWLTTHSEPLAAHIARATGTQPLQLYREEGATCIQGQGILDRL